MKAEKNNKIKSLSMPYHQYFIYFCEGDRRRMKRRVLRVLIRKCIAATGAKAIQMLDCDEGRGEERCILFFEKKYRKKSIFLLLLLPWREPKNAFFSPKKKIESTPQSETNDRLALVILKNHHKCCCPSGLA